MSNVSSVKGSASRNIRVAWRLITERGMDDCSSMCLYACSIGPIVWCLRLKLLASSNLVANKIEIAARSVDVQITSLYSELFVKEYSCRLALDD